MNFNEFINKSVVSGFVVPGVILYIIKMIYPDCEIKSLLQSNIGSAMTVVFLNISFLFLGGIYLFFRDNYLGLIIRFYLGFLFFVGFYFWVFTMK